MRNAGQLLLLYGKAAVGEQQNGQAEACKGLNCSSAKESRSSAFSSRISSELGGVPDVGKKKATVICMHN